MTQAIKKSLWFLFAIGATLSAAFLSFTGMLAIFPTLFWGAGIVFVLAAAYESQVNGEGIWQAFDRFNPNYLSLGLVRRYLSSKVKTLGKNVGNNLFLAQYAKQKKDMKELEKHIESCENDIRYYREEYGLLKFLRFGRQSIEAKQAEDKLKIAKHNLEVAMQKLQAAKAHLHAMDLFFLKQLKTPTTKDNDNDLTEMEKAAQCLVTFTDEEKKSLLKEIRYKTRLIRGAGILTIAAGVCSGLVTLSLMQAGVVAIGVLSSTPIGLLVSLAILAGAGYTFLMYQNISEMIQKLNLDKKWKTYFSRHIKDGKKESTIRYCLRLTGIAIIIACGILATVASAGTCWPYAKDGVVILGRVSEKIASAIRTLFIALTGIPTLIYYTYNSLRSVNAASRVNFTSWKTKIKEKFDEVRKEASKNVWRFFNIPLLCEKLISNVVESVLFGGHVVSTALMGDGLQGVSPGVTITSGIVLEVGTNIPYLPGSEPEGEDEDEDHHHNHTSFLLRILFFPIRVTSVVLKSFAVIWDYLASGCEDFKESCRIIFDHKEGVTKKIASLPHIEEVSVDWDKQEKMEACDQQIKRLESSNSNQRIAGRKVDALKDIKKTLKTAQTKLTEKNFSPEFAALDRKRHRHGLFFKQSQARSAQKLREVFNGPSFKINPAR